MSDLLPTDEVPEETPEETVASLDLGIELSPEERAEAEQMVAHLKSQFGLDVEEEEVDEPTPGEEEEVPEEAPVEPEPEPTVAAEPEWISIDGRSVPVAEARSMLELRQYLAQNPDKAEAVRAAIEDVPETKQPEPPKPPEWLDLEDPSQRFFWEQTQRLQSAVEQIAQNQRVNAEQQARTDALQAVNVAMTTFRTNHPELTEDEVQTVRTHAVALNIIPGLQQTRNGTDAVLKALDIAYMDHPDFRAKQTGQPTVKETKQAEAKERRQKLAGVSGSGTTATRTPEQPKHPESDREMRAQAVQWLREQNIL